MDPDMIRRALMSMRNAPTDQSPGLSQAYDQPATPALQQQGSPSFQFDPQLEGQVNATGGNTQLEPIVQQIMKHLGMMNLIRNRSNQTMLQG